MNKFTTISGLISNLAAIVGVIFGFINPTVTIICAIIALIDSFLQITFGEQNNLVTEFLEIIIGLIVAWISGESWLLMTSYVVCMGTAIVWIVGIAAYFIIGNKANGRYSDNDDLNLTLVESLWLPRIPLEDQEAYKKNAYIIKQMTDMKNKAEHDLSNGATIEDLDLMLKHKQISQEKYDEFKNAIESLQMIIRAASHSIKTAEDEQQKIMDKYDN